MATIVDSKVCFSITGVDDVGCFVEKNRSFGLAGVHVFVTVGSHTRVGPSFRPIFRLRIQHKTVGTDIGLLDNIAEYIVAPVSIDDHQSMYAVTFERCRDVAYKGMESDSADTDSAHEITVLMGAAEGERWEQKEIVVLSLVISPEAVSTNSSITSRPAG